MHVFLFPLCISPTSLPGFSLTPTFSLYQTLTVCEQKPILLCGTSLQHVNLSVYNMCSVANSTSLLRTSLSWWNKEQILTWRGHKLYPLGTGGGLGREEEDMFSSASTVCACVCHAHAQTKSISLCLRLGLCPLPPPPSYHLTTSYFLWADKTKQHYPGLPFYVYLSMTIM